MPRNDGLLFSFSEKLRLVARSLPNDRALYNSSKINWNQTSRQQTNTANGFYPLVTLPGANWPLERTWRCMWIWPVPQRSVSNRAVERNRSIVIAAADAHHPYYHYYYQGCPW